MIRKFLILLIFGFILSGCVTSVIDSNGGKSSDKSDFTKGGVPANFPPIPFYPDANVLEGYGSTTGYGASALTGDELAKVVEFYNKNLTVAGWEYKLVQKDTTNFIFEVKNAQYMGEVIVNTAADGKTTAITFSLSSR